ncbi:MAG: sugar ABC transporter substrate-binding protein [bacterium]|nr:sugar ABC transporter substrate-binding protein [bacterium]
MYTLKHVLVASLVVLTCLGLTYGQAAAQDPVNLRVTVWTGNDVHLNMLNGMAEKYIEAHPNVSVKFDTIPFTDYVQTLTIQLAGSNPPDVGWILESSAPTFIGAGVLAELSDVVQQYDYADFSKPALKLWERGDKVYGIPFSTSPFVMFYNKDLFAQAGAPNPGKLFASGDWTWEKFAEVAKTIKDKTGVYGFQSVSGQGYNARIFHTLMPIVRAYGGDAWDAEGNCLLNSPESVQAISLYHSMIFQDKSVVPPGDESDFFAGNAAMTINQISRTAKLTDVEWQWDMVPMPKGPVSDAQVIGQAALVAFQSSKNADVAAEFVAFMTNKENVQTMTQFFPPARVSVMESEAFLSSNPLIAPEAMESAVLAGLKKGIVLPSHANFPKIELISKSEFDNLWRADADVQKVMNNVAEAIQPLLK